MSDNKFFGIETNDRKGVYIPNEGNQIMSSIFEIDDETKKACAKIHEDINNIKSPSDKARILAEAFPSRDKDIKDLVEKTDKLNDANKKYDKANKEHNSCSSAISDMEQIREATENLIKTFPELAPSIRKYSEAAIKAAIKGEKNKEPKPATKLPFWKKALKPVAKLFDGKANVIDNITWQIDFIAKRLEKSPDVRGKDEFLHVSPHTVLQTLKDKEKMLDFELGLARNDARNTYNEMAPLKLKDNIYKAAEKEVETKAPEVMKKNKIRGLLEQRGLMPATKGTKDVSGIVKVDQNVAAKMAQKKVGR